MNNNVLHGKLKDDFKINKVGEKSVAKGTLIVDKPLSKVKKEEAKSKGYATANFPQIVIWGSDARIKMLTDNVKKGDKLMVEGFIETGSYEKKDTKEKVYTTVINVREFDFEFKPKEDFSEVEI